MAFKLSASDLWSDVVAVRERSPLVHSITNLVVMGFNANVLLAAGASPVMAHAHEEVRDMAGIAQALVLNIGTLDSYWVDSMKLALVVAAQRGIPSVLDPVGAGATPYRNQALESLFAIALPTVIRGNGSEIMSTAGATVKTRGVDSSAAANDALGAAQALAGRTGGTVCVSGEIDHVFDARRRWARLSNGHAWMTRITGVGCSATALIGAFCAVQPDAWRATTAAMAFLGVVGEVAAEKVQAHGLGVGSMAVSLLDELQLLEQATFETRLRLELATWQD
ncbi:hydroxyethylthiazole kinase [Polaromonas jejuensis]|uniref:Hydroxyethylthiazole kinase n=1 Tax=Polaromonas jejuensis TaxID=457502 RepID=A0ABW0QDX5_9BURK|nr:hydroxyethylthiazole kinase [Polaromonas jejuensis]